MRHGHPLTRKQNKRFSIDGAFLSGNGRRGGIASRGMYSPIPLFPPLGEWGNREWPFLEWSRCLLGREGGAVRSVLLVFSFECVRCCGFFAF